MRMKLLRRLLRLVFRRPRALLALILYPIVRRLLLPFRLLGIAVDVVFELRAAIFLLPARLLGGGKKRGAPRNRRAPSAHSSSVTGLRRERP